MGWVKMGCLDPLLLEAILVVSCSGAMRVLISDKVTNFVLTKKRKKKKNLDLRKGTSKMKRSKQIPYSIRAFIKFFRNRYLINLTIC